MTFAAAIERIGNEIDLGNLTPHEVAELLDHDRILKALNRFGWNQCHAADSLGMHRNSLNRRMEILGIERPDASVKPGQTIKRPIGRPRTERGLLAKALNLETRKLAANGLDREISPLVIRIRLRQMEKKANLQRKHKANETEKIEQMLKASSMLSGGNRA